MQAPLLAPLASGAQCNEGRLQAPDFKGRLQLAPLASGAQCTEGRLQAPPFKGRLQATLVAPLASGAKLFKALADCGRLAKVPMDRTPCKGPLTAGALQAPLCARRPLLLLLLLLPLSLLLSMALLLSLSLSLLSLLLLLLLLPRGPLQPRTPRPAPPDYPGLGRFRERAEKHNYLYHHLYFFHHFL